MRRWAIEVVEIETVELDGDRFIQLETYRQWPKLGVAWWVRQRSGESDFPLTNGAVDRLPRSGEAPENVWGELRDAALSEARQSAENLPQSGRDRPRGSFLSRLFGRK